MSTENLLLEKASDEGFYDLTDFSDIKPRQKRDPFRSIITFHLSLIAAYTALFFVIFRQAAGQFHQGLNLVHSPAHSAVWYEKQYINNDVYSQNVYKGAPRPELDAAWADLFRFNNIRVTKQELERMNRTSIQLADGSNDYLAALDVYHHLHCVKMIRQYLHPDYYEMPHSQKVETADHIDHCLDALRQELMCRAEVSLTTYDWHQDITIPWAHLSYDHTCANFEAIDDWARSRSIDIFTPGMLIHPTRGPSYPHGAPVQHHHR